MALNVKGQCHVKWWWYTGNFEVACDSRYMKLNVDMNLRVSFHVLKVDVFLIWGMSRDTSGHYMLAIDDVTSWSLREMILAFMCHYLTEIDISVRYSYRSHLSVRVSVSQSVSPSVCQSVSDSALLPWNCQAKINGTLGFFRPLVDLEKDIFAHHFIHIMCHILAHNRFWKGASKFLRI